MLPIHSSTGVEEKCQCLPVVEVCSRENEDGNTNKPC